MSANFFGNGTNVGVVCYKMQMGVFFISYHVEPVS